MYKNKVSFKITMQIDGVPDLSADREVDRALSCRLKASRCHACNRTNCSQPANSTESQAERLSLCG